MRLIGLIGKKKSSKTTVANYISELLHPKVVATIGFADALKDEIAIAIGRSREYIDLHKDNFHLIMQGWGTDFRRKLCRDTYWLDKVEFEITCELTAGITEVVVIPDVRFVNEAEMIRKHGGTLILLHNRVVESSDNHQSEIEMEHIHPEYMIDNSGDLQDLKHSVKLLLRDSLNLYQ